MILSLLVVVVAIVLAFNPAGFPPKVSPSATRPDTVTRPELLVR